MCYNLPCSASGALPAFLYGKIDLSGHLFPWRGGFNEEASALCGPMSASAACLRGGEDTVDRDNVASNCSTENCLPNVNNKIINPKSSNWEIRAVKARIEKFEPDEGFQPYHAPFRMSARLPFGRPPDSAQVHVPPPGSERGMRPISVLRFWISEVLTQS